VIDPPAPGDLEGIVECEGGPATQACEVAARTVVCAKQGVVIDLNMARTSGSAGGLGSVGLDGTVSQIVEAEDEAGPAAKIGIGNGVLPAVRGGEGAALNIKLVVGAVGIGLCPGVVATISDSPIGTLSYSYKLAVLVDIKMIHYAEKIIDVH